MRKILFAAFICLVVAPFSASGAIRYEFQQVIKTDPPSDKSRVTIGSAFLDRGMSRVDYAKQSTRGGGTWVISRNGGKDTIYVDPESKTYLVRSRGELSEALSGVNFKVSNLKIDRRDLGSGPIIAGYPTDHHRITATYDVSISLGPIPLMQHVEAVIDKWTTPVFGDAGSDYFQGNVPHSGDPEIDKLLEAETTEVPGFPLRQLTTITTRISEENLPKSSQLQVERARRQTSELLITKIGRAESDPSMFQIPAGYEAVDESSLSIGALNYQSVTPSAEPE